VFDVTNCFQKVQRTYLKDVAEGNFRRTASLAHGRADHIERSAVRQFRGLIIVGRTMRADHIPSLA
jgi:hypothetical protein